MSAARFLFLMAFAAWTGCASSSKTAKVDPKTIDWNERIGSYTYDQALAELGRPAIQSESSEGRAAEWILRRSANISFGFGVGVGSVGPHTATGVGVGTAVSPPARGEYLRLTFDREGKLKEWTKVKY